MYGSWEYIEKCSRIAEKKYSYSLRLSTNNPNLKTLVLQEVLLKTTDVEGLMYSYWLTVVEHRLLTQILAFKRD